MVEESTGHKEQQSWPSLGSVSTHKGGLELMMIREYFEFEECLLWLRIRSKGGERPIALDSVLGS